MKIKFLLPFLLIAALLASCASPVPAPTKPAEDRPAAGPTSTEAATAIAPAAQEIAQRGTGAFDRARMESGLENLSSYKAHLSLEFDGTNNGQPYHILNTFTQVVDRETGALSLEEYLKDEQGSESRVFSAAVGPVRYHQSDTLPCQAGQSKANASSLLQPAQMLPPFLGAEEVGQESAAGQETSVYQFDQQALGAGEVSTATGKIWIARDGGWVVRYELTLKSDAVFGEGFRGEQRWSYEVSEVGSAQLQLPENCPPILADFPAPETAQDLMRMPGTLRFTTDMSMEALGEYYESQLTSEGWVKQSDPVETSRGTQWLFSKASGEQEWVAVISVRAGDSGLLVTAYRILTDAVKPE
jgi:hypothetical protein